MKGLPASSSRPDGVMVSGKLPNSNAVPSKPKRRPNIAPERNLASLKELIVFVGLLCTAVTAFEKTDK